MTAVVSLRTWRDDDYQLLEECNTVAMTAHLGGPESPAALKDRHRRYVDNVDPGGMFVVVLANGDAIGSIGYWEHSEADWTVWETGWAVIPDHQGKGVASKAIQAVVKLASAEGTHRTLHAYPAVDNAGSNALCRKTGFSLLGPRSFEYPKGHWMTCNDWSLNLAPSS
ncbi:MAG: GNAT family N-acetyltransferase [Actinomycetota bacterium]|nr:GNAT family N-acetyltransferase [Actinomycetota bacterium]